MKKRLIPLLLLTVAPGCVLLHPTDPYGGVGSYAPGRYGSTASRAATTQPIKGPVTLQQALKIALANNPEIAAVRHDVGAAQAQRDVAKGAMLPKVNVVGGYTRYLDDQRLVPARFNGEKGVFGDDIFSTDLIVTMPLFTGGRLVSEIKAAELLQKATEHRLARSREELVFNVSSVFYGILAQRHVIESLEFSRKTLQEHLKRVNNLIDAQKAAKVDRLRTEVRLADLEQQLVRVRNILAIQGRVLANLLGVSGTSTPVDAKGALAVGKHESGGLDANLSKAFERRPDYLAARSTLEAQATRVDAARAAHWPTVSLRGSYGGRWAAGPSDRPAGTDSSDDVGQVGVVVDIPIFEGGQIEARVRRENAKLAAAQQRLRKLELQVHLDVETATLNIGSSLERVQATRKSIEQGKESLRIEQEKYDLGKGSITDVLDAQSALLDSQTNYYRALTDYNISLAQLRFATGNK